MGVISSTLLVGFGMNSFEYNGSFGQGLSFNAICGILALPAAAMVPVSWYLIDEPRALTTRPCRCPRPSLATLRPDAMRSE